MMVVEIVHALYNLFTKLKKKFTCVYILLNLFLFVTPFLLLHTISVAFWFLFFAIYAKTKNNVSNVGYDAVVAFLIVLHFVY